MTVGNTPEPTEAKADRTDTADQTVVSILDAVEDGVALFDRAGKFIHCNNRFRTLFPKIGHLLVSDATMSVIAQASVAAGYGRGLPQDSDTDRGTPFIPRTRGPQEHQITDGRWIWMKDQITPDGGLIVLRRDITNRVVVDMRLNLALDAANQGIWDWYPATWTLFFNRTWRNTLGYSPDDLTLFHRNWPDFVHPDDRETAVRPVEETIAGRLESFDVQYRFRRADGSWAWIHTRSRLAEREPGSGVARRIVGLHIDISRERESEIAIQAALDRARTAEERLLTAIETLPQGFILFDAERRLICANAAYLRLSQGMAEEIRPGMLLEEMAVIANRHGILDIPAERLAAHIDKLGTSSAHEDLNREIQTPDGRWLSLIHRRTPDGGYVAMRADITEPRRQEQALREALTKAEAASLAKTQFLANMSHELRTPLNAILGFSEIMREAMMGPISATYASYAADIHVSGTHLLKIINDILDLSKLTLWSLDLNEEIVDPLSLLLSCATLIRPLIERSGVSLVEETPPIVPRIKVDPTRIKQILLNLLSNAKKYSRPGGEITLRIQADEGGLAFVVHDTGIGIDPADIPAALEPFRQVGDLTSRGQEGTGLGLPLAKAMIEAHGGSLRIDSAIGVGTIVSVRLPPERVVWSQPDTVNPL